MKLAHYNKVDNVKDLISSEERTKDQLEKRRFQGNLILVFLYPKEAYKKSGEELFTRARGNVFEMTENR